MKKSPNRNNCGLVKVANLDLSFKENNYAEKESGKSQFITKYTQQRCHIKIPLESRNCENRIKQIDCIKSKIDKLLSKSKEKKYQDKKITINNQHERNVFEDFPLTHTSSSRLKRKKQSFNQLTLCDSVEYFSQKSQMLNQSKIQMRQTAQNILNKLGNQNNFYKCNENQKFIKIKNKYQKKLSCKENKTNQQFQTTNIVQKISNNLITARQNWSSKYQKSQKLQNKQTYKKQQKSEKIKQTAQILCIQIDLQIQYRNLRQQFQSWRNPSKNNLIQETFLKYVTKQNSLQFFKKTLKVIPQQYDPFFQTTSPSDSICLSIVQIYNKCFAHWFEKAKQYLTQNVTLIKQDKKQHLSIQDLICFANIHSGKYYRNRDVFKLFKRLSTPQQHYF